MKKGVNVCLRGVDPWLVPRPLNCRAFWMFVVVCFNHDGAMNQCLLSALGCVSVVVGILVREVWAGNFDPRTASVGVWSRVSSDLVLCGYPVRLERGEAQLSRRARDQAGCVRACLSIIVACKLGSLGEVIAVVWKADADVA